MKLQRLTPNVYVTTVYPHINLGLILTDEGPIAVDAPLLPQDARAWRRQIVDVAGRAVHYTLLTDHRPERALGASILGAPVVAGRGTFRMLKNKEAYLQSAIGQWAPEQPELAAELERVEVALPQIAAAGQTILQGTPEVSVESVAGPAPGSVWVRVEDEERVLFAGDTFSVGVHPFLEEAPDTRAWLETLVYIRRSYFPADILIPGRGPVSDKAATYPLSEYIQLARRRIRSLHIADGSRSDVDELVPEFMTLFPLPDERQEMVRRRIRAGLERVYEELRPEEPE